MSACIIKLPAFEGPLDLLLHLVRKNKLDIFDLPISLITEQYLAYLEMMKALDLDVAGEYLLMAATLLYIKSQMLLPRPSSPSEEPEDDPREEIVRPLLELAKFQEAAQELLKRPLLGETVFQPPGEEPAGPEELSVSLFELLSALRDVLKRRPPSALEISRAKVLVTDKIREISERVAREGRLLLSSLFAEARSREEAVAYFLAILELAFREEIRIIQTQPWGEVEIIRR